MPGKPDSGSARALAWVYSPAAQQPPLAALCAIEREIGANLRPGLDHQVAHARLAWWREECARCVQGSPSHPLTRELRASVPPAALPALAGVAGLVDAAVWDLATATFGTRRELDGYCERWSTAMVTPLACCAVPPLAAGTARELGRNLRELELLLALAGDARAGRIRVPLDALERAGVAPEELAQPPWRDALAGLLRERHRELRAALAAGVHALTPAGQAGLRGLVVWAAVTAGHSLRAEQGLPRAGFMREPHLLLDGWRAWRAARRTAAGRGAL